MEKATLVCVENLDEGYESDKSDNSVIREASDQPSYVAHDVGGARNKNVDNEKNEY